MRGGGNRWRERAIVATRWLALVALAASACAPHGQYRDSYDVCTSPDPDPPPACDRSALQRISGEHGTSYLMGFVEFDDQGLLWSRDQMWAVENAINDMVHDQDLLMVVFVHGWKHNADPYDDNIWTFRKVLSDLAAAEASLSTTTGTPARQVVGVYLAWRGASFTVPYLWNLTFWDRKNTAQKVGYVGVAEVLSRLEQIQRTRKAFVPPGASRTSLVVVGHSFGGAVVATALAQTLENRFVATTCPGGAQCDVDGFGDLVVLINPAFEATLFAPLSDMATERGRYAPSQLPVIAVLTSEADSATGYAFPAGRRLSTLFEKERYMTRRNAVTNQIETIDEEAANVTAVGHFEPYRTHWLRPSDPTLASGMPDSSPEESVQRFLRASKAWQNDTPGSSIRFDGVTLERTKTSAGRNPYLMVRVDRRLIPSHNDITDPRIIDFVKQLILLSTHSAEQAAAMRRETHVAE